MSGAGDHQEALASLAMTWVAARRQAASLADTATPVDVPEALMATVAGDAAARDQVREDAALWLARAKPFGFGLACVLLNADEIAPGRAGDLELSPARFQLDWLDGMCAQTSEHRVTEVTFARLARVGGAWKVAALWSKAERRTAHRQIEAIKRLLAR